VNAAPSGYRSSFVILGGKPVFGVSRFRVRRAMTRENDHVPEIFCSQHCTPRSEAASDRKGHRAHVQAGYSSNSMRVSVVMRTLLLLMFLIHPEVRAQFGPLMTAPQTPQAKSSEELDSYLEIYRNADPGSTIALANRFAATYPQSEFLALVYERQTLAYQQMNNYERVLQAGDKALSLSPRNINVLLTLALAIPNGVTGRSDSSRLLEQAESYARQALKELEAKKIPQDFALEEWEALKAGLESECHEALGHVNMKRGDLSTAVNEFHRAAFGNPKPNSRQFLRLSSAYLLCGQRDAAEQAAERAVDLGEGQIRQLALQQLQEIRARSRE
jgi:tetratricopeptide (TPR) repeat protein